MKSIKKIVCNFNLLSGDNIVSDGVFSQVSIGTTDKIIIQFNDQVKVPVGHELWYQYERR